MRVSNYTIYDGVDHSKDISKDVKYTKEDGVSSSGWGYESQNYQRTIYTQILSQSSSNLAKPKIRDIGPTVATAAIQELTKGLRATPPMFSFHSNILNAVQGEITSMVVNILIGLFASPPPLTQTSNIEYHNYSYEKTNPLPLFYSRVELIDKQNNLSINGKSVFEYTSNQDMGLLVPSITGPFSNQFRYYNSFYGLPKRTTAYDNTGFLLKETLNEYELKTSQGSASKEWIPFRYVYDVYPWVVSNGMPNPTYNWTGNISENTYYTIPNHTELKSSIDKFYNKYNNSVSIERTDFTYNLNNVVKTITTHNSKGSLIEKRYYYPNDYNTVSLNILAQLVNANIISTPISTETWQTRLNQNPEIISNSVSEFFISATGDLKPLKSYELETQRPLTEIEIGSFNPNNPSSNLAKPKIRDIGPTVATAAIQELTKGLRATPPMFSFHSNILNAVQGEITSMVVNILIGLFASPPPLTQTSNIEYHNYSYEKTNPLPLFYSRVELIDKQNNLSINGKSVFEYTSNQDMGLLVPSITGPFSNQFRYYNSFYGLPKRTTAYDNTGFLLKETLNEYELKTSQGSASKEWIPFRYVYDVYPWVVSNGMPNPTYNWTGNISENTYYTIPNHTELKSSIDKFYNKYNNSVSIERTDFTYNLNNVVKTITTHNSKGSLIEKRYYYPNDYNTVSLNILAQLVNANIISTPISTETWQTRLNQNPEIISNSVSEFFISATGDLKPLKSYELETQRPLTEIEIGSFNPNNLLRNSNFVKSANDMVYDLRGNLIELRDIKKSKSSSFIYNTLDKVIASVSNGADMESAYTSFENSEASDYFLIFPTISTQSGIMGLKSGDLTDGSYLKFRYNVYKESILSLWASSSNIQINNTSLPAIVGPEINGWTYYQYIIPENTPALKISGNARIDEVRLYPKNALMKTVAYEPGKGISAECNIYNQITYYEYDGLGRLSLIRDQSHNILKKFCYNYYGQVESCPLITSVAPHWVATGNIRCRQEICATDNNYTYGVAEKEEKDINSNSPSSNTLHWIIDITRTCPTAPDYQPRTDLTFCEQNPYPLYTGNKITPTVDRNPCSPTYNQWGPNLIQTNVPECTPCFPACTDSPEYKCINGVCVHGEWKIVKSVRVDKFTWKCTRAWCFPNGEIDFTGSQVTIGNSACALECF